MIFRMGDFAMIEGLASQEDGRKNILSARAGALLSGENSV